METLFSDNFPCRPLGLLIYPNAGEFVRTHAHVVIEVLGEYRIRRTDEIAVKTCNRELGACIPGWRVNCRAVVTMSWDCLCLRSLNRAILCSGASMWTMNVDARASARQPVAAVVKGADARTRAGARASVIM